MTLTFRKHPHYPDLLFGADGLVIRADKLRPTDILTQKNDADPFRLRKTVKLKQLVPAKELLKDGVRLIGKTIAGKYRPRPVAELILEAYGHPKPEGHYATFEDGDQSNLSTANLRWSPTSKLRKPRGQR